MNPSVVLCRASARLARVVPAVLFLLACSAPLFAQDTAAAPAAAGGSLMDTFRQGGAIGWVIVALSVVALAAVIENFVTLRRDKLAPPELIDEIQALFDEGQYQEAMELCENEPTFFTRVCGAGVAKIGHPYEVIEKSITEMGDEEAVKLHQKIGWLSVIANVAPMLGLLGTVSGMISAFRKIAEMAGQASPAELADGIAQALITTMFGLIVAIPVSAAFAYLRNNLVRSVIEVGAIIEDLFERFRPQQG